jgi:hypothetical protein
VPTTKQSFDWFTHKLCMSAKKFSIEISKPF